jgi:hypothetical protein
LHQKVKVWVTSAPALENSTASCSTALHIETPVVYFDPDLLGVKTSAYFIVAKISTKKDSRGQSDSFPDFTERNDL